MFRFAVFLSFVSISVSVSAAVSLVKYQTANGDCAGFDRNISHLITQTNEEHEVVAGRVSTTIDYLKSIRSPRLEDTQVLLPALKSNLEGNLDNYLLLVGSDCAIARAKLANAMLISASKPRVSQPEKLALIAAVKDDLKKPRYPTYASCNAMAATLGLGTEKTLWTLPPADVAALAQLRQDLKTKMTEVTPKLEEALKAAGDNLSTPEKLKTSRKFQALKKNYVLQATDAEKFLAQLRALAEKI